MRLGAWLIAVLVLLAPGWAGAQVFLAERPQPEFTIGSLFVTGTITPEIGPLAVDIMWSLVVPPTRSAVDLEQNLYLLWPGEIIGNAGLGAPDPELTRYVETRGFTVIDEGRLTLLALLLFQMDTNAPPESIPGGAAYVTFVRENSLGLSSSVTYIKIPWVPQLANRTRLMKLQLTARGLIKPRVASWFENTFWGPRSIVSLSFSDVRARALFPLYFEHRDRLVRLAEDPSQILLNFRDADHLKIDSVSPPAASRRLSEALESTEVVSLFLDPSGGLTPQVLTVQFGYFSGLRAWAPVLIPTLFFVLGNVAGVIVRNLAERLSRSLAGRFLFGRDGEARPVREQGVVLSPQTLARIMPDQTTAAEVVALCGEQFEERRDLGAPERRTLIYRGRRVVPQRRPIFGWLATVSRWNIEHHEVEIQLTRDVVREVQARVRREQLPHPGTA